MREQNKNIGNRYANYLYLKTPFKGFPMLFSLCGLLQLTSSLYLLVNDENLIFLLQMFTNFSEYFSMHVDPSQQFGISETVILKQQILCQKLFLCCDKKSTRQQEQDLHILTESRTEVASWVYIIYRLPELANIFGS